MDKKTKCFFTSSTLSFVPNLAIHKFLSLSISFVSLLFAMLQL